MAVTVQKICDLPAGGTQKAAVVQVTDTSYATGGTALVVPGFEKIKGVVGAYAGTTTSWDLANQKILTYWDRIQNAAAGLLVEVTAAQALGTGTFIVVGN